MNRIWMILGLELTRDIPAIRHAYAQKTLECHPEEDPEGFMELQNAYQAAMAYAEGKPDDPAGLGGGEDFMRPDAGEAADFSGQEAVFNPYADHPAIRNFLELYTGKQRKDSKRWLDYFTSDAFLDVAWEWCFTELLLEHIIKLEKEYPVNREFLNWLCVAYQFTVKRLVYLNPDKTQRTEFQFQIHPGAEFEGQEAVFEIAAKGPAPRQLKGNELAVFTSFTEYRILLAMAEKNVWSEQDMGEYSQIIRRYASIYITDKCQQRGDMDYERHPAGLRLMTHFLHRRGLPEELYRITWQNLNLETTVMGREKILYGAMREMVLERLPELSGQPQENFAELKRAFHTYAVSTCKIRGVNAQATKEDIRKTDAFFVREDFQKALLDRRFVENEMLHTWVNEDRCDYYLKKVIAFYQEHQDAPCAGRVIKRARDMLKFQRITARLQKDREAKAPKSGMTLKNSSFFRHWLNTGFYQTGYPDFGMGLLEYLNRELPYLPEWSKKFLEVKGEEIVPKSVTCTLGGDSLEVRFHLRYMEFLLNREPVYRPCLEWERVAGLADTDAFFFCLPVTVTTRDQYEAVSRKILRRLGDTAAPEDGRETIAGCLAGQVCSLPMPEETGLKMDWDEEEAPDEEVPEACSLPPESVLPFELFDEDTEHLYVCEWIERTGALLLFEQLSIGRRPLRDGKIGIAADAESAVALARQALEETVRPSRLPMDELVNLPDAVYAAPDFHAVSGNRTAQSLWSRPVELLGEAVTRERLEELLTGFGGGLLERLEFSWKTEIPAGEEPDHGAWRSLVFLKGSGGYVCLYFDDFRAKSFALLERPELFGEAKENFDFVDFGRSKLFSLVIHHSFSSIRRRLDVIFRQVSWPGNVDFMAGGIWDHAINVFHGRSKYNLDKQLLADFPMERAHNRTDAPFYFFLYPDSAACVDGQGSVETMEIDQLKRKRLQQMMTGFLQGGFRKLRLTFGKEAGRRRHIVLLQDNGRFLLAWILEEKRTVRYHVADVGVYMDVEGKEYPKDTFRGRVTPAYLIHDSVAARNELELLLANLDNPDRITGRFAEYATENPVKERPYEALWAELAGDTLEECE
ncbi:MAG: J domain-containing protein [Lachnospiraceae bacterium]|nr:J domain-containing protein [Lachnospiraceae bacterium]MCM1240741.1 J domain-containing protein [Lachnospiraceae bacterium]